MPLLTVRLSDEQYAALKKLAVGSSMADLIRGWIREGHVSPALSVTREVAVGGVEAIGTPWPGAIPAKANFGMPKAAPKPPRRKR